MLLSLSVYFSAPLKTRQRNSYFFAIYVQVNYTGYIIINQRFRAYSMYMPSDSKIDTYSTPNMLRNEIIVYCSKFDRNGFESISLKYKLTRC